MKKICFVITKLTDGGAERVTSLVSSALADKEDSEVHLLTFEKRENEYELSRKILRHNLEIDNTSVAKTLKSLICIRKYLKNLKCSCYVGIDILANVLVSSLGMFSKRKTVISERNAPKQVKISRFMKILRRIFYPFADCVVFQTEGAKNDYPEKIAKKGVIIPNPVKSNLPRNTSKKHVICAAARLTEEKNHYLLINSFKKIVELHPDYSLSIFGQGAMEQELKEYVRSIGMRNHIIFEGYCTDVHERMKDAEIFVLSSNYEGLPNSLLEAMGMGFAVISTDCPPGGPRSLIDNERNGLLVPVGNEEKMTKAILRYIEDPIFRENAGSAAIEVNDKYSIEKITLAWQDCIENVLQK